MTHEEEVEREGISIFILISLGRFGAVDTLYLLSFFSLILLFLICLIVHYILYVSRWSRFGS